MATDVQTHPLPGFSPPPTRHPDPPLPPDPETDPAGPSATMTGPPGLVWGTGSGGDHDEQGTPRRDRGATRSTSSAGERPTVTDTAELVAGLLLITVVVAGTALRWTMRRRLRQPTDGDLKRISTPLAAIGLRHFDASWLNRDMLDATKALAATGVYLNRGPLLEPLDHVDPGLPDNLQEPS